MRGNIGALLVTPAILACLALAAAVGPADARRKSESDRSSGGVPYLDVKGSCADAQKFSSGIDKDVAFKGCMQDEMSAKDELGKRWTQFKSKDRTNCVEQSRFPSPSYVEVLTCLEMDSDAIRNAPKIGGVPAPQLGGPVAPGLSTSPNPSTNMPGAPPNP